MKHDFILNENAPIVGIGKTLFILGTSEDGPVMQPVLVTTPDQASQIFGDRNKGTLVKSFEQAYDIDSTISIYMMRISGKSATFEIVDSEVWNPTTELYDSYILRMKTKFGGEKYNNCTFQIVKGTTTVMKLTFPEGSVEYVLDNFMSLDHLVQQINADCRAKIHPFLAYTRKPDMIPTDACPDPSNPIAFVDGADETDLSKDEMYIQLVDAYKLLVGRPIDVLIPTGVYVDDVHPVSIYGDGVYGSAYYASNRDYLGLVDVEDEGRAVSFHEQLINFCREQNQLGYMTHGVIGIAPLENVPDTIEFDNTYIKRLVETTVFNTRYGFTQFKDGQWDDKGFYISVFASEFIYRPDEPDEYYDNGAVSYAALITGHYDTTTNMPMPGNIRLRYELDPLVLADLSKLGVVTCMNSVRNGIVVTNGVTCAHHSKDLHSFANVRMVQLTIAHMNDVVRMVNESEMDSDIRQIFLDDNVRKRLEELKEQKVLTNYTYKVVTHPQSWVGRIDVTLETKYTVEAIATSASVSYLGV